MQQTPEASTPLYEVTLSHSLTVPKDERGQDDTAERVSSLSHLDSAPLCHQPAMWIWRGHLNSI